jgi:hypothetical protein
MYGTPMALLHIHTKETNLESNPKKNSKFDILWKNSKFDILW